ncbi:MULTISPECIES: hypothetical protein [Citrobacter]|uniref:hypothetical protein n=1 Tax=Citrobacter TaxID=544 RepID=UPI000E3E2A0D|nr:MULTISPECIES: hypothetical protein [Citrobacter]RFU90116.1 hypothetical protein DZA29_18005 [Citrobacter gillenii]
MAIITKLSALAFTTLPGANRVVLFYIIAHVTTTHYFGLFSSAYSYAIILSMVGGVGVGTEMLKYGAELGIVGFIKASLWAVVISLFSGVIILLSFGNVIQLSFLGVALLSIGLTMNQILRYMIIVKKNFLVGAINELIFILPPLIFIFYRKLDILTVLGSLYIIQSLLVVLLFFKDKKHNINAKEAFLIGHSNLISSGILYFLPIISLILAGSDITKVITLMVTTAGIITVFPRAILNMSIRDFQTYIQHDKVKYAAKSNEFKRQVSAIMLFGIIIMIAYGAFAAKDVSLLSVIFIGFSIALFIFLGQYSILETTMINLVGKEKLSLMLNLVSFLIFLATFFILQYININSAVIPMFLLCLMVSVSYLSRYLIMKKVLNEV